MFCSLIFDSDEFWGDALALWAKLFMNKDLQIFVLICSSLCTIKCMKRVSLLILVLLRASLTCCGVEERSFVL